MLRDEERITKLIKKVFEDEFKKQEQTLAKIISGNLEITMQEIKSFKNEVTELEDTAQKMKFSIKGFFSKCDQIRRKLQIWSHLLKKSLMVNFIFCAVRQVEKE